MKPIHIIITVLLFISCSKKLVPAEQDCVTYQTKWDYYNSTNNLLFVSDEFEQNRIIDLNQEIKHELIKLSNCYMDEEHYKEFKSHLLNGGYSEKDIFPLTNDSIRMGEIHWVREGSFNENNSFSIIEAIVTNKHLLNCNNNSKTTFMLIKRGRVIQSMLKLKENYGDGFHSYEINYSPLDKDSFKIEKYLLSYNRKPIKTLVSLVGVKIDSKGKVRLLSKGEFEQYDKGNSFCVY